MIPHLASYLSGNIFFVYLSIYVLASPCLLFLFVLFYSHMAW